MGPGRLSDWLVLPDGCGPECWWGQGPSQRACLHLANTTVASDTRNYPHKRPNASPRFAVGRDECHFHMETLELQTPAALMHVIEVHAAVAIVLVQVAADIGSRRIACAMLVRGQP